MRFNTNGFTPSDDEQAKPKRVAVPVDIKEFIQNGKTKKDKKKVVIKPSHLKEFEQLWQSIYKNASFILEKMNDEEESQLINNIKTQVEALDIKKIMLETIKSESLTSPLIRTPHGCVD